ncbi:hypothetical protein FHR37_005388 [Actinopolymorpha cephalotaxi]|uniref:Uncharacterized protein n=1 Tax=Actinopolymorpha cephalotaxi TaxID=504797 RepID=A0ABX2SDC7_9ACTN|nr:hypothetical protein [Actinopolymorpha cephalotaxi]
MSEAVSHALEVSEPYRDEALRRGTAAYAALRGEVEVAKPHRKRKWGLLLLVGALGGAAIAAYRALKGSSQQQWQPMPSAAPPQTSAPASPPAPGQTPETVAGSGAPKHASAEPADTVGASPGEAVADRTPTPPIPTTPDAPAEHVETSEAGEDNDRDGRHAG